MEQRLPPNTCRGFQHGFEGRINSIENWSIENNMNRSLEVGKMVLRIGLWKLHLYSCSFEGQFYRTWPGEAAFKTSLIFTSWSFKWCCVVVLEFFQTLAGSSSTREFLNLFLTISFHTCSVFLIVSNQKPPLLESKPAKNRPNFLFPNTATFFAQSATILNYRD